MEYISELIGTFLLVLLGTGCVANIMLKKSGMNGGGAIVAALGWGFAVFIPVSIFAPFSGAHINPVVTLAFAAIGDFAWSMVPLYILCQFTGAFLGSLCVFLFYRDMLNATDDPLLKRWAFCTSAAIYNPIRNFFNEVVCTFILIFSIIGLTKSGLMSSGTSGALVFAVLCGIGMSLGGATGYAMNPARDLAPRFAHWILPIRGKGPSDWKYAWVTLLGPIVGSGAAVLLNSVLPW